MNARIERLKELLKQSPTDGFILFALAKEYEKLQLPVEAIRILTDLIAEQPEYIGAYYHLAAMLKQQNQFDTALEVYQKGIEKAKAIGDQHALRELQNAKLNLEIDMEE
jgi:tetratricopeptide (TPR) repeat protein